jgi:RHS repeat-associated protein
MQNSSSFFQGQPRFRNGFNAVYSSPFGVELKGRNLKKNNAKNYRFGFQGQEGDDQIKGDGNSYDFGARIYDSRLGRWLSPDDFEPSYPALSSFVSMNNSPLFLIDNNGDFIQYPYKDEVFARSFSSVYQDLNRKSGVAELFRPKISTIFYETSAGGRVSGAIIKGGINKMLARRMIRILNKKNTTESLQQSKILTDLINPEVTLEVKYDNTATSLENPVVISSEPQTILMAETLPIAVERSNDPKDEIDRKISKKHVDDGKTDMQKTILQYYLTKTMDVKTEKSTTSKKDNFFSRAAKKISSVFDNGKVKSKKTGMEINKKDGSPTN